jgi:hypothetical protein
MSRLRVCVGLLSLTLLAAGCADGASTTTSTGAETSTTNAPAAGTTGATPPPTTAGAQPGMDDAGNIVDARTIRLFVANTVVAWGVDALDPSQLAAGITTVYPVGVSGSAVEADPTRISLISASLDDKDVAGSENPHVVAFAVADTTGACLGGVVWGYPAPNTVVELDPGDGEPCTAGAVLSAWRAELEG